MRILIAAVGSRGDVVPLTGLGTALRGSGYDVSVASYGMFEELITGCGLGFRLVTPSCWGHRSGDSGGRKAAAARWAPSGSSG